MGSKEIQTISFLDILPSSISGDEKIQAAARALDAEFAEMNTAISDISKIFDVQNCSMDIVKHLAWALHVDFWDENFLDQQKRDLVEMSLDLHKKRGTPEAVEQVLKTILGGGIVEEYHEYGGRPFHFRVISNAGAEDEQTDRRLRAAIEWAKNRRSILDAIIKAPSLPATHYVGGIANIGIVQNFYEEA